MWFGFVSLFPEMYSAVTDYGVIGRAIRKQLLSVDFFNPRDFATDKHRTVDDRPYGGGPGMLMKVQPLQDAITEAKRVAEQQAQQGSSRRVIYLSPQGAPFNHKKACELADYSQIICISGRYEGVDERLIESEVDEEISIGDFVLSGGELASMVLLDATSRLIPGVLGHEASAIEDSFVEGLLDCPHYTRPEEIAGQKVPGVLLSGDHEAIRQWRLQQSLGRTWQRRPDLLDALELTREQKALLDGFIKQVK